MHNKPVSSLGRGHPIPTAGAPTRLCTHSLHPRGGPATLTSLGTSFKEPGTAESPLIHAKHNPPVLFCFKQSRTSTTTAHSSCTTRHWPGGRSSGISALLHPLPGQGATHAHSGGRAHPGPGEASADLVGCRMQGFLGNEHWGHPGLPEASSVSRQALLSPAVLPQTTEDLGAVPSGCQAGTTARAPAPPLVYCDSGQSLVPLWLLFFFTRKTEARTRLVISQLGSRKPCGHTCGLEVSQSRDLLALTA